MTESFSQESEQITGIGKTTTQSLQGIGVDSAGQLKGLNLDELYEGVCERRANLVDRWVFYLLRCAVYYASQKKYEPELFK
jgi:hypothetical protein